MTRADRIVLDPGFDAVLVEWSCKSLRALRSGGPSDVSASAWRLAADPEWGVIESLRLVSAAFEDGQLLALVAVLPTGAEGHDATRRRCVLVDADGEINEVAEALLSTEYDAEGSPSRIGLELYTDPDAAPMRVAADRTGPASGDGDARAIPMSFRMEGSSGAGMLELVARS